MPSQSFTTAGDFTFKPSDYNAPSGNFTIRCVAIGGNGEGGGGGGGENCKSVITLDADTTYHGHVSAAGETSWFSLDGGTTHDVEANPGNNASGDTGGTGGSGGNGDERFDGGAGADASGGVGGGAGAGGRDNGAGSSASGSTGGTGGLQFGIMNSGNGPNGVTEGFAPNGNQWGSGGAGSGEGPAFGGAGGAAKVQISWTLPDVWLSAVLRFSQQPIQHANAM